MNFYFIKTDLIPIKKSNIFYATLPKNIKSEDMLFDALYEVLGFPDYFGCNWNAVYDCMCDFTWITEKKIKLIHKELPNISDVTMAIYFRVLIDVINTWNSSPEKHVFEVIFDERDKETIQKIIDELNHEDNS